MEKLVKQMNQLLAEGSLSEGRVLDHSNRILNLLRECNVCLRWAVLHAATLPKAGGDSNKRCKVVRDQVGHIVVFPALWVTYTSQGP